MLRTEGIEYGSLLKTPSAMDAYSENLSKKEQKMGNSGTLAQEVSTGFVYQRGLLPTPTTMDHMNPKTDKAIEKEMTVTRPGRTQLSNLRDVVVRRMLPTPSAEDNRDRGKISDPAVQRRIAMGKQVGLTCYMKEIGFQTTGQNSQLNPLFVLEMMGFPSDWTLLPFLSGEQNQSKPEETQ
jgi:hypothetical protein